MANELVHGTVGTTMTQTEFETVGLHVCNSQATGDLIYASSATQLSRLAIGAAGTVLTSNGTVPAWSGAISVISTTTYQAVFSGYTVVGATANAAHGSIKIGSGTTDAFRLDYAGAGNTTCYIDSLYDNAGAAMVFRMKAAGTPLTVLTLTGAGGMGFFSHAAAAQPTKAGHNNWAAISDVTAALAEIGLVDVA